MQNNVKKIFIKKPLKIMDTMNYYFIFPGLIQAKSFLSTVKFSLSYSKIINRLFFSEFKWQ